MSRAEGLHCQAELITAVAAAEEAIAVDLNTLVGPATLARMTSSSSTPPTQKSGPRKESKKNDAVTLLFFHVFTFVAKLRLIFTI